MSPASKGLGELAIPAILASIRGAPKATNLIPPLPGLAVKAFTLAPGDGSPGAALGPPLDVAAVSGQSVRCSISASSIW